MTTTHNTGLAHCVHHNIHFEWCYDLVGRHGVIDRDKPKEEQAIRHANLWLFPLSQMPAEWQKADAEWQKAEAEWQKAYEWPKAYAEWQKAYAEWQKAYAETQKAYAEWAPDIQALHDRLVQEQGYVCTWNGQDIFEAKGG